MLRVKPQSFCLLIRPVNAASLAALTQKLHTQSVVLGTRHGPKRSLYCVQTIGTALHPSASNIISERLRCTASALDRAVRSATSMDKEVVAIVHKLHCNSTRAVFYVTGGGFQALSWLLTTPGASNTVLEARVPYDHRSVAALLGKTPPHFASLETATDLAQSAYRRAAQLSAFGAQIVGVSCTCALATDRPKKGDHKAFVAIHNGRRTLTYSLGLAKGARDRVEEDDVASRLLLRSVAESCGLQTEAARLDLKLRTSESGAAPSEASEAVAEARPVDVDDPLEALHEGRVASVEFAGGQIVVDAPRDGRVYLPGSFNPVHEGHRQLLAAACRVAARPEDGCFELSIGNPDKGLLPLDVIRRRVQQFIDADLPIVVVQAPLYTDKARLFGHSIFVVGYDTAIRLVMEKYYGGRTRMLLELAALRHRGCSFLVAGRREGDEFLTLADVELPSELAEQGLFESIPEEAFRSDLSSTELRDSGKGLE